MNDVEYLKKIEDKAKELVELSKDEPFDYSDVVLGMIDEDMKDYIYPFVLDHISRYISQDLIKAVVKIQRGSID